ncbi:unnamed protein product, partial [Mycena citricolor]
ICFDLSPLRHHSLVDSNSGFVRRTSLRRPFDFFPPPIDSNSIWSRTPAGTWAHCFTPVEATMDFHFSALYPGDRFATASASGMRLRTGMN